MSDPLDDLESELSQLRPMGVPADLVGRVAAELDAPLPSRRSIADRCLMTFIGGGGVAASVIICLIGWQVLDGQGPPTPLSPPTAQAPPSIATYQQALARSDGATLELLR